MPLLAAKRPAGTGDPPCPGGAGHSTATDRPAHSRRPRHAVCGAWLLAAAVTGAALDLPASSTTTRIAGVTYLGDAPTLVAERRGHFADQGLQAEVRYGRSGKRNLERLRAGDTDFALMALTPLALDLLADPSPGEPDDPVILASLVHATRLNAVVAPTEGPIQEAADLAGRKIGLSKGTGGEFVWWLFERYHGLRPGAVQIVDLAADELAQALASGDVDAAVMWAPWRARLQARTGRSLRKLSGGNVYTAKWVLVTRREVAERDPARARALLRGYADAIEYIHQRPIQALDLYAEHAGLSADLLHSAWDPLVYHLNLDWSTVATLQQQLAWAGRGDDAGPPPSILPLLAPAPLRALAPGAVGIPPLLDAAQP